MLENAGEGGGFSDGFAGGTDGAWDGKDSTDEGGSTDKELGLGGLDATEFWEDDLTSSEEVRFGRSIACSVKSNTNSYKL